MKEYIEERAVEIANYIVEHKGTVRQAATKFGVLKSTVHIDVTKKNCALMKSCKSVMRLICSSR